MRLQIDVVLDYVIDATAEVLLQVEAAATADQRIEREDLRVYCTRPPTAMPGEDGIGRRTWATGEDSFRAEYAAVVEVVRDTIDFSELPETPLGDLPVEAVPYLMPSRYCESDRFEGFVQAEFGALRGGALAAALAAWVSSNLSYVAGSSAGETSALITFAERRGVCRDYAHLMVALARAGGIPARCVSAYAPGVDPPDFHAVAELWLGGGWHLIDTTGMSGCGELVRVVVGRDATDIAFMTIFGTARLMTQSVQVMRLDDAAGGTPAQEDRSTGGTAAEELAMDNSIDDKALGSLSVAPPDPEDGNGQSIGHTQKPEQDAGRDESIARRMERDPENSEARLDAGLDQSMDASDPPSSTQPVHNTQPAESSGYDAAAEEKLKADKQS